MSGDVSIQVFEKDREINVKVGEMDLTRCSIDLFNEEYSKLTSGLNTTILPPAIRNITRVGRGWRLWFETPPQYRSVGFTNKFKSELDLEGRSERTFMLPFPWLRYYINLNGTFGIEDIKIYAARKPITGDQHDTMSPLPVHNIYDNASLCRPTYKQDPFTDQHPTLFAIINRVLLETWESGWNADLQDALRNYISWAIQDPDSSMAGFMDNDYLAKMYHDGNPQLALYFYSQWQQLTMKQMMSTYFRAWHFNDLDRHSRVHRAKTDSHADIRARVLMAAQNASNRAMIMAATGD